MNKKRFLSFLALILLFVSCRTTKVLKDNEYLLTKNNVKVVDVPGTRFDDLVYLIRPETNTKFMNVFNLKTAFYAAGQKKWKKKTGELKDTKFRRWMRESIGEPPVLLDSSQIHYSMEQIGISMRKNGYFDAETSAEVLFYGKDKKKAKINYSVTANTPSFIREIHYDIAVPEFRKIILLDSANRLFKAGDQYNETILANERNRITNLIKNKGYFYFSNGFITMEVDTVNMHQQLDVKGRPTLSIIIKGNTDNYRNEEAKQNLMYRYTYNRVYIYTNYDLEMEYNSTVDTTRFRSYRNKKDSTVYYFITPKLGKNRFNKQHQLVKDFKYRTLTDMIYTKKGWAFSSDGYSRSYKRLNDLNNFSIINIEYIENRSLRDTILKKGVLDVRYKLTRSKLHSLASELTARSDRANLSFTYSNRNIFRGAEKLSINVYGGVVYQNALHGKKGEDPDELKEKDEVRDVFGNIGGTITLDFPHLFLFKQKQKIEALRYSTSVSFGANYSWQYNRFMMNTGLTYNWRPNYQMTHSMTPIMISTIHISEKTKQIILSYPESLRKRFGKDIIFGLKYGLNYLVPTKKSKHVLQLKLDLESSGLMLYGLNKMGNAIKNSRETWTILGYNYTTYEKGEFTLRYTHPFNKNSSIAARVNVGAALSFTPDKQIPFENSFYLGGANSMRGWAMRTLGPGAYSPHNQGDNEYFAFFERVGDVKLEMNLEYRGTLFKAFKYGLFADMGNVWLLRQYEDMPGATFQWKDFYKQIALAVGAGLRLDFNFFLIRIDYGLPIYNPSMPKAKGYWINDEWGRENEKGAKLSWMSGFQFAIGHAF